MKKLMFVAAVAAGMVAFGDAIESQNVVGYNQTDYRKKYTLVVPEFSAVGATGLHIQSIRPVNIDMEDYGEGDIKIQTFTDMANMSEQFYWYDESVSETEESGWHNSLGTELSVKTFAAGEGFMLYMPATGGSLKYKAVSL